MRHTRTLGAWLCLLLGLFCLRVAGQMLVAFWGVAFLPPMEEWFSGAISYGPLLASQAVIIALYGKVCLDFTRGRGFFTVPRRALGLGLLVFGSVYFGVMVIRYVLRMSLYPQERWTGGSIPIFFHWVLAGFLLLVGRYHWKETRVQKPSGWKTRASWTLGGVVVTLGVLAWIGYQLAPWALGRSMGLRPSEFAVRIERGTPMSTSDGVTLAADVYRPLRAGRTPTILVRINYSKTLANTLSATIVGRMWAERGYTVVLQGTRGRYESGGRYYPLRGERQDGLETLAWLVRQPWFDGRLGMWGGSYFGYTQWVLADQVNPGPSALMVQIASTDFYRMFYPGGAFSLESGLYWAVRSHGEQDIDPAPEALNRGARGFPLVQADDRAAADTPFFNDWVSHPERASYWESIDAEDRPSRLAAPILLMAGWYDPFLPTQLEDFIRIRRTARPEIAAAARLIVGPWSHARAVRFPDGTAPRNYRLESLAPSIPWFDRHLRKSGVVPEMAPVRLYVMGEHVWRDEQEWPLARARSIPFHLRTGGNLTQELPALSEPPARFVYDPLHPVPSAGGAMLGPRAGIARQNEIEARADVLTYRTSALEEDLEVTGPIRLILYVSTTAANTDFTGKLVDIHPGGSAYNVSEGILRRPYTGVDQPVEIHVDLWPTSMLFRKGHRIGLEVSSSSHPRFDANPNTGGFIATETRPVQATQTIHYGRATPSRLELPVVPRK